MPRGIPWDDLTLFREKKPLQEKVADLADAVPEQRDFQKDSYNIGKRALFGLVVRKSHRICSLVHYRKTVPTK
jgi:hypothetical protein